MYEERFGCDNACDLVVISDRLFMSSLICDGAVSP